MSHHIKHQVHEKFKIFTGEIATDKTIGKLADEVASFAHRSKVAAKSIGVAYLESLKRLVITLGYRDDEEPYPIKLHCVPLGKIDVTADDLAPFEQALAEASSKHRNVICHELYLTSQQDCMMVLMTHQKE